METGKELRLWLKDTLPEAGDNVHQDNIPQLTRLVNGECESYEFELSVFFTRTNAERDDCLTGEPEPDIDSFAVEIIGPDIAAVKAVARKLQAKHGFQGEFGDETIYGGVFVTDQDDDYEFFNPADAYGLSVVALGLEIFF